MNRRNFCATSAALAMGAAALAPTAALAQPKAPQAGGDYVRLSQKAPVDAPAGKIELIEFFWYGCPHCNAFEPVLAAWVKQLPADVVFKRVPIAFQSSFVPQQHLFYALDAMGLVDKMHARVFAAVHQERLKLVTPEAITDWVGKQGVDKTAFASQFNSFTTAAKVRRATQLMAAYQVEGVPALGVAGRFYTDGALTQSMDRALRVTEFLLSEVRAGR